MAATNTDIVIEQGADFSQDFTVTSTSGKTYEAKLYNRFWEQLDTMTATVSDGTTVSVTHSATDTGAMVTPDHFAWRDYSGQYGWYVLEETTTATGAVARMYYGKVTLHRRS